MNVIKRDGSVVEFDRNKITIAIKKALEACDMASDTIALSVTEDVVKAIGDVPEIDQERVQDLVEDALMKRGMLKVAKAYIKYRYRHAMVRDHHMELVNGVLDKLAAKHVVNQNANIDEASFAGRMGEANTFVLKSLAMDFKMSDKTKNNYVQNIVYQHDAEHWATGEHNCVLGSTWVTIKHGSDIKQLMVSSLANDLGLAPNSLMDLSGKSLFIADRNGWTKLQNIFSRPLKDDEKMYRIRTAGGLPLIVTEDHQLPIVRNEQELLIPAKEIRVGDYLLDTDNVYLSEDEFSHSFIDLSTLDDPRIDLRVIATSKLKAYLMYKYNMQYKDICESLNFALDDKARTMKIEDYRKLVEIYPLPLSIVSSLRLKSSGSKHTYPMFIPYTPQLAKVYAYIYADGGVYERESGSLFQLTFTNTNEKLIDDFIDCYESVFGYRLNKSMPQPGWTSPCIRVVDCTRLPCKLFRDFAGARKYSAADISVPDFVINGSDEIKYAYLSACIDTDGCVESSKKIVYNSCCKTYCDQLQKILSDLGIQSQAYLTDRAGSMYKFGAKVGYRNFDAYQITVNRAEDKEKLRLNATALKLADVSPYNIAKFSDKSSRVISVSEHIPEKDTLVYDFETESHWFVANNYVSHNCLTLPLDKLLEKGFKLRQGDIRPPQSISTALQQLVVIMQLQSTQMFGGVAAMADFALVPYVRKSFKKHFLKRAFEEYMHDRILADVEPTGDMKEALWKFPVKESWYALDDEHLDFVEKAFNKWYMEVMGLTDADFCFACTKLDASLKTAAKQDTRKETQQAVEGLYHNLVSIQARSGAMLPFSSLNYGCCTEPEGRLVTECIILGCMRGIGKHHSTAIFPCGIFISKDGVNRHPGEPNYDLFQLALASTAKRLYPNYANANWTNQQSWVKADRDKKAQILESLSEIEYAQLKDRIAANPTVGEKLMLQIKDDKLVVDNTERPYEYMSSMGCLDGSTKIDYYYKEEHHVEPFEAAWKRLAAIYPVQVQPNGIDLYIDTPDVRIYECNHDGYVKQFRIIRNHSDQWIKLTFYNGEVLHATPDHPFTDICKIPYADGTVLAKDLTKNVRMFWDIRRYSAACISTNCEKKEPYEENKYSYDVTTETGHFMAGGIESHNCRTVNGYDINSDISYKQAIQEVIETGDTTVDLLSGAQKTGRGNIAPVTIILPELAMMANRDVETFMQLLEITIQEAADSLIERYEIVKSQPPSAAPFQYGNHTMAGYIECEGIDTALRHGTFAIGQLGVAETLQLLIGTDQTTPDGLELAKRIEQLYKDKINALRTKYKMNFGVYASPSESLCYTALKKFQARYGKIPNVSDKEFFTNSMHVPVWRKMSPFDKIDIESQLTGYFTAGIITYVELDSSVRYNLEALEKLVLYAMDKDIPYFAVNTPNDQCQDCGYEGELPGPCIKCGSTNIKRLRRITGYLSSDYHYFNAGKINEVEYRTKHIG